MSFESLGLSNALLQAVEEKGYQTPSPIQLQAIPSILEGRDLMAAAQTGTGKTAGFTLPLLQRLSEGKPATTNRARALVLTPTRELALQVSESVQQYGRYLKLKSTCVYGGVGINPQMMALRRGVDVLVATPGRLLDLHTKNAVRFDTLEMLVLDEADRMLDMGFIRDIEKILALLPSNRQNLMFSATFSGEIRELAKGLLQDPVEIDVSPANSTATTVQQWLHPVDKKRKADLLCHLIHSRGWYQVLVFTRTKRGADKLVRQLAQDSIRAAAIHGDKSQGARVKALEDFKKGRVGVLVATDIAARGLDIEQLPQVVNFDLPNVPEDYVHRIGRTGRAGAKGRAISLVSADEVVQLRDIERLIKKTITRDNIVGFEPEHDLPASPDPRAPVRGPKKSKKPKKNKTADGKSRGQGKPARKGPGKPSTKPGGRTGEAKRSDSRSGNPRRQDGDSPRDSQRRDGQASDSRRPRSAGAGQGGNRQDGNRQGGNRQGESAGQTQGQQRRSQEGRSGQSRPGQSRPGQSRPGQGRTDQENRPRRRPSNDGNR